MYEITIKSAIGTTIETVDTMDKVSKRLDRLSELGIEEVNVHQNKNPCPGCTKQYARCHSLCPVGVAYSQHRKHNQELVKAERSKDAMIGRYEAARISKRCEKRRHSGV